MIRAIDVETTGVDPEHDAVIEIASVDLAANGQIANEMQSLVNPGPDMLIPPDASAVHHLMDEDVALAPPFREVIGQFQGADFYVAHQAKFEIGFLGEHLGRDKWVCTYKCALRVWPDFPGHSNQALRYRLGLERPFGRPRDSIVPHRAAGDVIVTAGILFALLKAARWAELVQWSSEPALHTVFTFGKHRGKKYSEVPADYLQWIVDKSDLDADTKFSAQRALDNKSAPAESQRELQDA